MSRRTPSAITPASCEATPAQFKKFNKVNMNPDAPLTEREAKYVAFRAQGLAIKTAYRMAGYAGGDAKLLEQRPKVLAALSLEHVKYAAQAQLKRQDIIDGIVSAIEQAKLLADPSVQIQGWKELGKLCGFYAPEVKRVELSIGAGRLKSKFEQMTDAELLEMMSGESQTLDGECRRIAP